MKTGNGTLVRITYTLTGPAYAGRKLFQNLNLGHVSAEVAHIALVELCKILKAARLGEIVDTGKLVGARLAVYVVHEVHEGRTWERVRSYRAMDGEQGGSPPMPAVFDPTPVDSTTL